MKTGVRVNVRTEREVQKSLEQIIGNLRTGRVALAAGTATVSAPWVGSETPIFLCGNADGSGTEGWLRVSTRTAGDSFTITSSSGSDTSSVAWLAITL